MEVASAVHLRRVSKRFGAKTAVDDVSLDIPSGGAFGLIGPNGAGKTTTFSMMAGYLRPTHGAIEVLGGPPGDADRLRSRVGVLPQDAALPAGDRVGEVLVTFARLQGLSSGAAVDAARRALADVEGGDWWSQRCGRLSHGMAKRVALAQSFLGDPELVLLDEPTAGLDPRAAWEIRALVGAKKGRSTIVISSHNLAELEALCDAAAVLDGGRVVTRGTMAELTSSADEVRVEIGGAGGHDGASIEIPLDSLRALPAVVAARFDVDRRELVVRFAPSEADAETVIARVLPLLLEGRVRISGVRKGGRLEERIMALLGRGPR